MTHYSFFLLGADISKILWQSIQPNLGKIIASLTASILLIGILSYYFWKPTRNYFKREKNNLYNFRKKIEFNELTSQKLLNKQKKNLYDSIHTSKEIITNAKNKAEEIIKTSINKAEKNSSRLIQECQKQIKSQELETKKYWHSYSKKLSINLTKQLLKKTLNKEDQEKIIDDFLKKAK